MFKVQSPTFPSKQLHKTQLIPHKHIKLSICYTTRTQLQLDFRVITIAVVHASGQFNVFRAQPVSLADGFLVSRVLGSYRVFAIHAEILQQQKTTYSKHYNLRVR